MNEPKIHDGLGFVGGVFTIELIRDGKNGPEVIERREAQPNLVVNTGKRQMWRMCVGNNTYLWDQMRVGTSDANPGSGNTNVLSPVAGTIKTVTTKSLLSGTRTMQLMYSYGSSAGSMHATGISEVAILNQHTSPGGSALCRATFTAVNKTTADKLPDAMRHGLLAA